MSKLFFVLPLMFSLNAFAESQCELDLSFEDNKYTVEAVFDGWMSFKDKSTKERADLFRSLSIQDQELLVTGLALEAPEQGVQSLEQLVEIPDEQGRSLSLHRILMKLNPEREVYRVTMSLGDNLYGSYIEIVGQAILRGEKRPLLRVVAQILDGDIFNCHRDFVVRP